MLEGVMLEAGEGQVLAGFMLEWVRCWGIACVCEGRVKCWEGYVGGLAIRGTSWGGANVRRLG